MTQKRQYSHLEIFKNAIQNLEHFTAQNELASIPRHVSLNTPNNALINRCLSFLEKGRNFVSNFFKCLFCAQWQQKQEEKRAHFKQELLRSIANIKKHYFILDRFKEGSEEQKKLAFLAFEIINRYNTVIHQSKQKTPSSIHKHVTKFLYKHLGLSLNDDLKNITIDLPVIVCMQSDSPKASENCTFSSKKVTQTLTRSTSLAASKKVAGLINVFSPPVELSCSLTQNELDAFYMKAITMIKNHAIPVTSIREALHYVKKTPLVATMEASDSTLTTPSSKIIYISQEFIPFPGEVIKLHGAFKRNDHSAVPSTPISESFQLFSKSIQNGSPHSSQYHGVSLSDKLIPYPLRLDLMPLLKALIRQKREVAFNLLPNGNQIHKAKLLWKLKHEAFNRQKNIFLDMHSKLCQAIIMASGDSDQDKQVIVKLYYDLLKDQKSSFEQLSQTMQTLNEYFIERPYNKLEEAWIENSFSELEGADPHQRLQFATHLLNQERENVCAELRMHLQEQNQSPFAIATLKFLLAMGLTITQGINPIILQQQSEKIEYAPPMLSDFAQLLQAWLYRQVLAFHEELNGAWSFDSEDGINQMQMQLKGLIETDIEFLMIENFEKLENGLSARVHELEDYYNTCFLSNKSY